MHGIFRPHDGGDNDWWSKSLATMATRVLTERPRVSPSLGRGAVTGPADVLVRGRRRVATSQHFESDAARQVAFLSGIAFVHTPGAPDRLVRVRGNSFRCADSHVGDEVEALRKVLATAADQMAASLRAPVAPN